ncbi:MAG TPA: Sir2 family NAD-dependent protein deacetylase [Planctomycetota bacterium]|nr:Sir2 family NAD-dependent protein deacetylase [Planctomycetota bacterium]
MPSHLMVLTGAGISADSGVRTFRDSGGLWEGHRPEHVATPEAWQRDPAQVWRFYQQRRAQLATVAPNAAHLALAALQQRLARGGHRVTVVTQNVDDLHERAGSSPLHMHGELAVLRCELCAARRRDLGALDADRFVPCPGCGHARLRPDVVWFGEVPYHLAEIEVALRTCTHFVAIGTSGTVWPAAGMLHAARGRTARTFVQALEPPHNLDARDHFVAGRAKDVVPKLLELVAGDMLA